MKQFLNFRREASNAFLQLLMLLMLCCFQPAFATPTTPTSDFIDNDDGTVTHKLTGLVWMRCAMGQTWDKATANCIGTAATYTWDAAMALKSNFAGKSDWRLPNIAELHTIVERENVTPAINTTLFPNTPNNWFWSSSPFAFSSSAWFVDFTFGFDGNLEKNYNHAVRLVRAEPLLGFLNQTTPTTDFTDNKNGTVTHKRTGLTWQRCSEGQTWTGTTCSGTATTYNWDAAMALKSNFAGKSDWRVPNENELLSIVEYSTDYPPAINSTLFPNTPSVNFWSSSPNTFSSNDAWIVSFVFGYDYINIKNDSFAVRFVRGQRTNVVASSPSFPDSTIAGDAKGWVNLLSFGNTLGNYMGLTAYMNNADGLGVYQSTDLAFRFAKNVLHLTNPAKPAGKNLAAANNGKTGYVVLNGVHTNIIAKYYPARSTTPPVNGSIISQTSTVAAGHVSIAKKIIKINDNTLDVYLFEQNWIAAKKDKLGNVIGHVIANSRKMTFTKDATGAWTGKTTVNNKAVGWLNPEFK